MKKTSQTGFTLIELMIATVVFSVVLLVILASFLQIGRMYYKGISYSNTQEAARRVTEDITNDIRFASLNPDYKPEHKTNGGDVYWFCVGGHRYIYKKFAKLTPAEFSDPLAQAAGILQDRVGSGCPDPDELGADRRQLLNLDMQVNRFDFDCGNGRCNLGLHIVYYGADDQVFVSPSSPGDSPSIALKAHDAACSGGLISSQFCAAVDVNTTILQRN